MLDQLFGKQDSIDFSDSVEPILDNMDYPSDQPAEEKVPSIEVLLKSRIMSRLFGISTTEMPSLNNLEMKDQAVSQRPALFIKESLPLPPNKTLCPNGAELYYFCARQMLILDLTASKCEALELPDALSCCPVATEFLFENCQRVVSNYTVLTNYLGSLDFVENFLFTGRFRDQTHSIYLKAYQLLSENFNINLEFPLFFSKYRGDAIGNGTLEYRRFLLDGTPFCYYYNKDSLSGKAKASPCPSKVKVARLDMSDMANYKVVKENIIEFNPPSWKEYCERNGTLC